MTPLFSAAGLRAVGELLARRPLLAFDFDGTLAPIVARPEDARVPMAARRHLSMLAQRLPLAIVTGRSVADLRSRLGFTGAQVVGCHGAEGLLAAAADARMRRALDPLRQRLADAAEALQAAGVTVEDKGLTLALHRRLARDPDAAFALIERLLPEPQPGLHVFGGKMVHNVVSEEAPDKAAAVLGLMAREGCDCVLFAGDDVNDEPVFRAAQPGWLTVRVGRDGRPTAAAWAVDSPADVTRLLEEILRRLPPA